MKLTQAEIAKLTLPEGKDDHFIWDDDLPGFGIRLRPSSQAYIIQGRSDGRQWRAKIGDVRRLKLDAARTIARRKFAQITLDGHPQASRAEAKARAAHTFSVLANQYIQDRQATLRPRTWAAIRLHLVGHFKALHGLPIHRIGRRDVAVALGSIAAGHGMVAAARARSSLSAFFSWAMREGLADANPVIGTNDPAAGIAPRDRVLTDAELRAIWTACQDDDFGRIVRLLILTGCRRDEIGGLRWDEIDLDHAMLHIPGNRTKNHTALNLPLVPMAVAILESAPHRATQEFVWCSRGRGFSAWSYPTLALRSRIMAAQGKALAPWRIHDIRRTVATRMGDLGVLPHVVESVLNHVSGHKAGVAGVYNKATYEREMRAAVLLWAEHLRAIIAGEDCKVVPLRPAGEAAG
jgi:integrase